MPYTQNPERYPAGTVFTLPTGATSTALADMDFETYSEAGYEWNGKRFVSIAGPGKKGGIFITGASVYASHPSAEVLSLAYNLKDGKGPRLWVPGDPPPLDLFCHIQAGKLIEAHNSYFEFIVWHYICVGKMGWPPLDYKQLRDSQAKALAYGMPPALGKLGAALQIPQPKLTEGTRLIKKFSIPRAPTKKDPRKRITPEEDNVDGVLFKQYNLRDIVAESEVSARLPDLSPEKLATWLLSEKINVKGVAVDMAALEACASIVTQAQEKYGPEVPALTGGKVQTPSQVKATLEWLASDGVHLPDLQEGTVENALSSGWALSGEQRRVLQIRSLLGSASVKKLFTLQRQVCHDGRLRDSFVNHGAHTGRATGRGFQPHNIPREGPKVVKCECGKHYSPTVELCPWCLDSFAPEPNKVDWGIEAVEDALSLILTGNIETVERVFGNAVKTVSGCLRGLLVAPPGSDLTCSDYSAIEAAVLAVLAGEQWRVDVFNDHGKIYEMSASKITGLPLADILDYKEQTGHHHPSRAAAKIAELASGYGGSLGAWRKFAEQKKIDIGTDDEVRAQVKKWRQESPNIVAYWQGLQDAAFSAVRYPGQEWACRGINFQVRGNVLFCKLPSGRELVYHSPTIEPKKVTDTWTTDALYFSGIDPKTKAWVRKDTYGGRLCENVVQAVSFDILDYAMKRIDAAGYNIVLHVHDEIVAEVPEGFGSVEELERLMGELPPWASGYPVRAAGGWRGKRYRKD